MTRDEAGFIICSNSFINDIAIVKHKIINISGIDIT